MSIDMMTRVKPASDPDVVLLQATADPVRLAILQQLSVDGPTCACDLAVCREDRSQPTVSHHLRVLREAGLIAGRRRGRWIWYSLRPEAVRRLQAVVLGIQPGASRPAGSLGPGAAVPSPTRGPAVASAPEAAEPDWRQW